ncbi:MAG: FAD-binding oxidoreductase [Lysobacterales bacterium]
MPNLSIQSTLPVWDDQATDPLPTLRGEQHAAVCVVGLGGSGLAALTRLREAGVDAVGVDAGQVGAGAAGRNGGFLLAGIADFHHHAVRRHGRERAAALYRLTLEELEHWYAAAQPGVRACGTLRIAADAAERRDCAAQQAALRADGLPVEPYAGPEGEGLLFPRDGAFQPLRRWRALAHALRADGVRLYGDSPVHAVDRGGVRCAGGSVRAPAVLVAVDGGLERLLPDLAPRVRSARLQMLATAPLAPGWLPRPVYYRDGYDYWQQDASGRVLLGGGRDVGGAAEWGAPAEPSAAVQDHLDGLLRTRLGVTAPVTHRWAACVAYSRDGLPVWGEWRAGLYVTGAYSGTGNVFGALCGRALADLALGRRPALAAWLQR